MNRQRIVTMLAMQDTLNRQVNPDWLRAGYPFLRAAMVESVEAIEHHGWKWWKKQTCNLPQLRMEVVDIWHFAMSWQLVSAQNPGTAAAVIETAIKPGDKYVMFDGRSFDITTLDTVRRFELLAGLAISRRFSYPLFMALMQDAHMNWDMLYEMYIQKNVLNSFRQDNGYKEGTYRKDWDGREDNEVLAEICDQFGYDDPVVLRKALSAKYAALA